jgi:hypothetical protein
MLESRIYDWLSGDSEVVIYTVAGHALHHPIASLVTCS